MTQEQPVVVFDIGGVLADWNPAYAYRLRIADAARRAFFLREVCGDEWLEDLNRGEVFETLIPGYGAKYPAWESEIAAYPALWREMIAGPIAGMEAVFKDVGVSGSKVFLFTNHPAETIDVTHDALPFLTRADGIFVSGLERLIKPDPAAFAAFEKKFDLIPGRTLLVDDELANVVAARSRGWQAVHFHGSSSLRRSLRDAGVLKDA